MVLTETMNYYANHIAAIRNNKDLLEAEFNVSIIVTQNRSGEYREVDISGYFKDIREVKKILQRIVDQAEIDYQEYRDRKRKRNRSNYYYGDFKIPTIEKPKTEKKENMFELLNEVEDETNYHIEYPEISNTYNPNLTWGDQ